MKDHKFVIQSYRGWIMWVARTHCSMCQLLSMTREWYQMSVARKRLKLNFEARFLLSIFDFYSTVELKIHKENHCKTGAVFIHFLFISFA